MSLNSSALAPYSFHVARVSLSNDNKALLIQVRDILVPFLRFQTEDSNAMADERLAGLGNTNTDTTRPKYFLLKC